MLTALLYLASVLAAVYALYAFQSSGVTHCAIASPVLVVGGGVYLIALGYEFVGLSLIMVYAGVVIGLLSS